MDGILIIDKPENFTSHDVVARLRRILKMKSIGHTGTLDPFATGVLVMLVGKATRLAQFLDKDQKEYEAVVRFGFETDTGDRTGERRTTNYELREFSIAELEIILESFRGEIEQTPPMYSAKKIDGKKLYELARKGIEVERKPVKVSIHALEIVQPPELRKSPPVEMPPNHEKAQAFPLKRQEFPLKMESFPLKSERLPLKSEDLPLKVETFPLEAQGFPLKAEDLPLEAQGFSLEAEDLPLKVEDLPLKVEGSDFEGKTLDFRAEIRVVCSAGTYIRTLAEDIGRKLKTGAHLAELRRTRAGRFDLSKAVTLEELEKTVAENHLPDYLISMNEAVSHLPEIVLSESQINDTKNGKRLRFEANELADHQTVRMIDEAENLVAVGFYIESEKLVQPKLVLV